jgi:GMP synthase PP-ATPase subunit
MANTKEFIEESMNVIKDNLGTEKGISACSGEVDATAATCT